MDIADKGARVGNYLVDTVCFLIILSLHYFILGGIFNVMPEDTSGLWDFYFIALYFAYYFLFEYFFGKTPGKFLTKTRVVDRSGNKITLKALLIRSFCRIIPIDYFTFIFGEGMHDILSKTQVICEQR